MRMVVKNVAFDEKVVKEQSMVLNLIKNGASIMEVIYLGVYVKGEKASGERRMVNEVGFERKSVKL